MGVAAYDGVETGGLRLEVEILEIVKHIKMEPSGLDNCGEGQFLRPGLRVHITAHGKYGSNAFELCQNFGRAHVSGMNYELHPEQSALCFRAEKTVGIGNDADPHGGPGNG